MRIFMSWIIMLPVLMLSGQAIDRSDFFTAFQGSEIEAIDRLILDIEKRASISLNMAYLGGLYMKKASFLQIPKEKLSLFRKGQGILEKEIHTDPKNPEIRLIRLIIQEKTPKILQYNMQIEEDKNLLIQYAGQNKDEIALIIKDYFLKSSSAGQPKS